MTVPEPPSNEEGWAALPQWGTEQRMNDLEALMWRGERHPEFSSAGVVVEVLDAVPDWTRFRKAYAWGVSMVRRLRQRVVEPALPIGPPAWADDPDFDLDYHLRRVRLPPPAGMRELLDLAQVIGETPLDRTRPLWTTTLAELDDGRAALVMHNHHCLMDGAAAIQLFSHMHSNQPEHTPHKPVPAVAAAVPIDPRVLTTNDLAATARRLPGQVVDLFGAVRRTLTAPAAAVQFVGSLRRVVSPPSGTTPSPLLARQEGRAWRFGVLECSLAELKAAGRAAGGSVNDAYMAALLGGLRRYHEKLDIALGDIPVAMPVSIRRPGDPAGGNRFAGAMFPGPAGNPDPAERIAAIRGAIISVRAEPALDLLGFVAPVLSRTPSALLGRAISTALPRVDLSGSNVPGLPATVYAAGTKVERMYVFGPIPGVSMLSTLCSYVGTCCIGINCDGAVYEDTALLWACMEQGLEEVLALSRRSGSAARTGRT